MLSVSSWSVEKKNKLYIIANVTVYTWISLWIWRYALGIWNLAKFLSETFPAGFISCCASIPHMKFTCLSLAAAGFLVVDYCSSGRLGILRIFLYWVVWTYFVWPFDDNRSLENCLTLPAPARPLFFQWEIGLRWLRRRNQRENSHQVVMESIKCWCWHLDDNWMTASVSSQIFWQANESRDCGS